MQSTGLVEILINIFIETHNPKIPPLFSIKPES